MSNETIIIQAEDHKAVTIYIESNRVWAKFPGSEAIALNLPGTFGGQGPAGLYLRGGQYGVPIKVNDVGCRYLSIDKGADVKLEDWWSNNNPLANPTPHHHLQDGGDADNRANGY